MEREKPLVTIITPSFNQGNFIEMTIKSVKNQDYPEIEHLIMDGGSTDGTLEILKQYSGQYNMRWISEPDSGQSDAVNKGFTLANGEIIGWLNSDDIFVFKDAVSTVVHEFLEKPEIQVLYGDCIVIDRNNCIKRVFKAPDWDYSLLLKGFSYIPQPSTFFQKEVIRSTALNRNLNFAMDIDLWLRLGREYPFHHINKIIAGDRFHPDAKRFCKENIRQFQQESLEIRKRQGIQIDTAFWIHHYLIVFYISVIRRLYGVRDILRLDYNEVTFAAELRTDNRLIRLWNQVFPWHEIRSLYLKVLSKISP